MLSLLLLFDNTFCFEIVKEIECAFISGVSEEAYREYVVASKLGMKILIFVRLIKVKSEFCNKTDQKLLLLPFLDLYFSFPE